MCHQMHEGNVGRMFLGGKRTVVFPKNRMLDWWIIEIENRRTRLPTRCNTNGVSVIVNDYNLRLHSSFLKMCMSETLPTRPVVRLMPSTASGK